MTHRNFGLIQINTSRRQSIGGIDSTAGAHGADTHANLIRFPRPAPSLGSAADLERQLQAAPLFILDDDTCAICVLAVVFASFITAIGLLVFAGYELFGLVG